MSQTDIPAETRRLVIGRAGRRCEYCLIHEDNTYFGCEVDPVVSEDVMRLSHPVSIAAMLKFVAIIAVNLAVWQSLTEISKGLPFGFTLSGLVLQVGLFWLLRSRDRVRWFWFGFVMAGLAAAAFRIYVFVPGSFPEALWSKYIIKAHSFMAIFNIKSYGTYTGDPLFLVCLAFIVGLPHLLIASAGGMLGWLIDRCARKFMT